mmetsp:Transcript_139905/g.389960  ORF Transcript_139905/g.389960 Transcript_139905/m.389960 type:complete len:244 (+) Transcript_139905:836-1567(+)
MESVGQRQPCSRESKPNTRVAMGTRMEAVLKSTLCATGTFCGERSKTSTVPPSTVRKAAAAMTATPACAAANSPRQPVAPAARSANNGPRAGSARHRQARCQNRARKSTSTAEARRLSLLSQNAMHPITRSTSTAIAPRSHFTPAHAGADPARSSAPPYAVSARPTAGTTRAQTSTSTGALQARTQRQRPPRGPSSGASCSSGSSGPKITKATCKAQSWAAQVAAPPNQASSSPQVAYKCRAW